MEQQYFGIKECLFVGVFLVFMMLGCNGLSAKSVAEYQKENTQAIEYILDDIKREAVNIQTVRNRTESLRSARRIRVRSVILMLLFLVLCAGRKKKRKNNYFRKENLLERSEDTAKWLSRIAAMEQQMDDMTVTYRENHLGRMRSGLCTEEGCILFSEMLTDFERIGDHILNIAQAHAKIAMD